jgi:putative transposase
MARLRRSQLPDGIWHVTSRGTGGIPIYLDDGDRSSFARLLGIAAQRFGLRIHAWCLLGSHFHLIVEAPGTQISAGMHWLLGVYAQSFNRRHGRKGHLYEERFRAWLIRDEAHLYLAIRYTLANPVRAGLCTRIEDWRWSGPQGAVPQSGSPGHGSRKATSRASARRRTASARPSRRAASAGSRGRRTRTVSRPRSPPCSRPR